MTNTKRILKEASESGKKVTSEIKKGLEAIDKLHELSAKCKYSPTKVYEQLQHGVKR